MPALPAVEYTTPEQAANAALLINKERNDSIIGDLLMSTFLSTFTCLKCQHVTYKCDMKSAFDQLIILGSDVSLEQHLAESMKTSSFETDKLPVPCSKC